MLYTWLITHCDTQGRIQGKTRIVRQTVVPFMHEIDLDDIAEALRLMEQQKLIILYEDDTGRPLIQVVDWWQWQTGLRYKAESHYQPPKDWEDKVTRRNDEGKFVKEES